MAIGLGRVFGFRFIENFNYPYLSKSVAEFWRRWHMSLGSWFRDYIYIPLGGNRVSTGRWVFNTLVVWMLTGMWHGAAWNFILWGLLYAVCLLAEKWIPALQKLPTVLRRVYTLLVVVLGFVLFNAENMTQAGSDIAGMFGFGGVPFVTAETLYYLRSYAVLFLVGFIGATPLVRDTANRLYKHKAVAIIEPIVLILLLLICSGYLVDGSFSPFLYFRF
jgi:alginate O-acetyltransferase complex protein AlgI